VASSDCRLSYFRASSTAVMHVDSTDDTASLQSGSVTTTGYDSILVTSLYRVNHKKRANVPLVDFLFNITQSRVGANPVPCIPDAPRLYERALCAPLLVSPVISRGAPRPAT
jgi:hypothetical protein